MSMIWWGTLIFICLLVGALLYWLLILTEGTYLGQSVVTWLYDVVANRYDDIKGFNAETEAAFLGKPLASALKVHPSPLVLDLGTGTGRLPLTLLAQPSYQGWIVGLDDSCKMLQIAESKLLEHSHRVMLLQHSASRLPFQDGVFDAVTCLEMLEFTPSPIEVLREAIRVLAPGGLLLSTRRTGRDARLMPLKTHTAEAMKRALLGLGMIDISILQWQMDYDLVWARRSGHSKRTAKHPLEAIRCPKCLNAGLEMVPWGLNCVKCGTSCMAHNGIIRMVC